MNQYDLNFIKIPLKRSLYPLRSFSFDNKLLIFKMTSSIIMTLMIMLIIVSTCLYLHSLCTVDPSPVTLNIYRQRLA